MSERDRIHGVVCELGAMSDVLQAMSGANQAPPLEWLHEWAERLHRDLDHLWLDMANAPAPEARQ